jgi:radical SAM superfamily enzyme YgiQ (UPF0313 family)
MFYYDEPVFRPPSEAASLILQATIGCSHNRCLFCRMYKAKRFSVKPWEKLRAEIDEAAALRPDTRRIFLADGDAFVLDTGELERILEYLTGSFPGLQRVSAYATPQNLLEKSVAQMKRLRERGLHILYYGVETGDSELLRLVRKGADPDDMVEGCRRAREAGIKLSITVILGLAGRRGSIRHARATAELLSLISPRYLSTITLMIGPLEERYRKSMGGDFEFNTPVDDVRELRELIANLDVERCIFRSNHASNYLPLRGTLNTDMPKLLAQIDEALEHPESRFRSEWMRGL